MFNLILFWLISLSSFEECINFQGDLFMSSAISGKTQGPHRLPIWCGGELLKSPGSTAGLSGKAQGLRRLLICRGGELFMSAGSTAGLSEKTQGFPQPANLWEQDPRRLVVEPAACYMSIQ